MTLVLIAQKINDYIASISAILSNVMLLYLIFSTNKKELRSLSRNLIQTCVLDLILAFVTLLAQPQVIITNNTYYLIVGSYLNRTDFLYASISVASFCAFVALNLYAMPVPFYLRYLVLCRRIPIETVYSTKLLKAYLPVSICFILTYAGLFWCYPPSAAHHLELMKPLNTEFWLNEYGEIPLFAATKITSTSLLATYGFATVCIVISLSLVIFYCTAISRELKKLETIMSEKTKLINRQVHRTLVIQAIGPFTAGQLPVLVLFILIFTNTENNYLTVICAGVMAWIPLVNPIAAIFIISPYRKRFLSWCKLKQPQHSISNSDENSSNPVNTTTIYTTNSNYI